MSPQSTETQTQVPDESEAVFEEIRSKDGHVPQAYRVLGPVPRLLKARWEYQAEVMEPTDTVGETSKQAAGSRWTTPASDERASLRSSRWPPISTAWTGCWTRSTSSRRAADLIKPDARVLARQGPRTALLVR